MSDERYVQVRLKRPILDEEGNKTTAYEDYVCWIPLALAQKAREVGKTLSLYHEELDEWRDGYILDGRDISEPISKERANAMHTRNNKWRNFKYAGRPSFKG